MQNSHKNFTDTLSSPPLSLSNALATGSSFAFQYLPITEKFFKYEKLECWSLKSQHWMKMKFKMCRKWFLQYNIELIKLYKSNSNSSLEASKSYWIILWYNIIDRYKIFINQTFKMIYNILHFWWWKIGRMCLIMLASFSMPVWRTTS